VKFRAKNVFVAARRRAGAETPTPGGRNVGWILRFSHGPGFALQPDAMTRNVTNRTTALPAAANGLEQTARECDSVQPTIQIASDAGLHNALLRDARFTAQWATENARRAKAVWGGKLT
jgi:hypothetical protein